MKMRKKISWLLSFFMVFSLFMGSAGMIVKADGQKAVVRIARQDSTATGTVYYKWDTAAEWTEVNQTAYNDTPIEINRPDDSLDHTVHFKVVCGTGTIINHCQVNKNGAQDASLDKNILTSESGQAFSVSTSEQVELIPEFRTAASGGSGSTTGPASGETIAVTATAVGGAIGDLQIDGMRIGSGMGTNISGSFAGDKTQQHRVAIAADFGYAFASIMVNGTAIPLGGTTDNLEFEVAPADSYQIEVALTTNSSRNYNMEETPCIVYVSEISHNFEGKAYCYGGGHYRRSHMKYALVGRNLKNAQKMEVLPPSLESIDYHFELEKECEIGVAAVMAFRFQIFVTRSDVVIMEGIHKGKPEIVGVYDSLGRRKK